MDFETWNKTLMEKAKQIQNVALEYTQSTFDNLDSLYDN